MALSTARKRRSGKGAPAWIVTFADLATLLLTFFILLLSFAEMDAEKYRAMANSMAAAFGSDTVIREPAGGATLSPIESDTVAMPVTPPADRDEPELIDERAEESQTTSVSAGIVNLATRMINELEAEVADEALSVSYDTEKVVVRFSEDATFRSGDAAIKPAMIPIIERVVDVLAQCSGDVMVAGHSDDRPIVSPIYRSNWDLSAARAVSVVHELVMDRQIPAQRVTASGRAETQPLVPNDSEQNRARNRRVELAIRDPACEEELPPETRPVEILP